MTRHTPLWVALVVVVLLGCGPKDSTPPLTSPGQPTTKTPDTNPQPQAGTPKDSEKEKPSDVPKVTAEELMKGFAEDEKATEKKYPDGGVIEITGVIYQVFPIDDKNSQPFIYLYGHLRPKPDDMKSRFFVSCAFDGSKNSPANKLVASLKPDQKVTVRGTNTGFFKDWLRVQKCVFIDPKP